MSLPAFQSALLRMIADPAFRDFVRDGGPGWRNGLSDREARRLYLIANDRGLDINRTLHKGFRLGKLRALLPFTCQVLGSRRLRRELAVFWKERPPSSFYFLPEALDFCDFLVRRKTKAKYLDDVMAYERATLELERASMEAPAPQRVAFRHHPHALLAALSQGKRPRGIPMQSCIAVARRDANGRAVWQLEAGHG